MALQRLKIDGFGQLEINNCAFRRDGRIEAQCKANETDFADKPLENGMILAVDQLAREITLPKEDSVLFAINYSAEHMYDERANALKDFKLNGKKDFLPRLGYLAVGDKFTSNTICYDGATYSSDADLIAALASCKVSKLYGGISDNGAIAVAASAPTVGPVLQVVEKTTMPDGTLGVKFQVLAD